MRIYSMHARRVGFSVPTCTSSLLRDSFEEWLVLRQSAPGLANCEKPLHRQTPVGGEKLSASSFREHSLPLAYLQGLDAPANKAMGDNVKNEMQTRAFVRGSLGTSEIPERSRPCLGLQQRQIF